MNFRNYYARHHGQFAACLSFAALMTVLAEHAALAMDNASLIDQLAGSREEIEGRAHAERSLREIAALRVEVASLQSRPFGTGRSAKPAPRKR